MKIDKNKLRPIREGKGLSQYELSKISGVSVVTINKLETTDTANPFPSTIDKIANALKVGNSELRISTEADLSILLKTRATFVKYLYEIDELMFSYIDKQMTTFKKDLGEKFNLDNCDLFEAGIFSGMSWSRPGSTTNKTNYAQVLGDLIALKNKGPEIEELAEDVDTNNLTQYEGMQCVYGLYTAQDKLIRIGSTTCLQRRLKEHQEAIKSPSDDLKQAKELIREADPQNKNYTFKILAKLPKGISSGLQRQFYLSYAETKLIILHKTYELANSASLCGDSFIPQKYAFEIMRYNHNIG